MNRWMGGGIGTYAVGFIGDFGGVGGFLPGTFTRITGNLSVGPEGKSSPKVVDSLNQITN